MKKKGLVFDIQRGSITNGPGIRTTVFLKGCPLNCVWCHNPESKSPRVQVMPEEDEDTNQLTRRWRREVGQDNQFINDRYELKNVNGETVAKEVYGPCLQEQFSIIGKWMEVEEIMSIVLRDQKFYGKEGGLTLSGGEPFAQPQFLLSLLKAARDKGIHTCIDTAGYCNDRYLKESISVTDLYLFDIKLFDASEHKKYTGKDNSRILNNLQQLLSNGMLVRVRFPIVPGINDNPDFLKSIAHFYSQNPSILEVELMPYKRYWLGKYPQLVSNNNFRDKKPLDPIKLNEMVKRLNGLGIPVIN
ncbi:glycyl-radical enzyme activating protein [Flavobacteriaceae bacterium TP-CH-4]|uniref:Glycyl-radical enzyme activating protein n=1 Tax=Pelagihabitans pacificus TaxID=2696054 RepID=A0A967ECH6_9FLAO|nr:glycyl-radical enzyme activating protein [Pelagihabitans pacificus]NHF58278.1 glycyl-radical enzyme activating protein [Pelagihabitans pacificus]